MRTLTVALAALLLPFLPFPAATAGNAACGPQTRADFTGDGVDDIVAGAPFAAVNDLPGAGAVQVVSGQHVTAIGAPPPAAGDGFGWSVAIGRLDDDDCADLVVGAPYADVDGVVDAGAVYIIYSRGERTQRIVAPKPQKDAHFGWSLAYSPDDGGVVAIGAPYEDDDGIRDAGAVYLFKGNTPDKLLRISQESEGLIGNSETGDMFGWSLALGKMIGDPDRVDLAVGVPYENNDGTGRQNAQGKPDTGGCIIVQDPLAVTDGKYPGVKWEMKGAVGDLVEEREGDRFGYALAYAPGHLAISAPMADVGGVRNSGLVHVLRTNGRELTKGVTIFRDADGIEGEAGADAAFGFSVALGTVQGEKSPRLAVGVPFDGPDRKGSVQLVPLADPKQDTLLTAPGSGRLLGWSVAFSGNRVVAGIPDGDAGGSIGVVGRNQKEFGLIAPKPLSGDGIVADVGASLAG